MALHDFQKALLELYTKPLSTKEFADSPEKFLSKFELTERERSTLRGLPKKSLKEFQLSLIGKRANVTKKALTRNPHQVTVMPFSNTGAPVVSWGSPPRSVIISPGSFRLLKNISRAKEPISFRSIIRAHQALNGQSSLSDVFETARLVYNKSLSGKEVLPSG